MNIDHVLLRQQYNWILGELNNTPECDEKEGILNLLEALLVEHSPPSSQNGKRSTNMKRYHVELKRHTSTVGTGSFDDWAEEESKFVYVMAYHRDQIVDMLGDEYFIVKIIEKEVHDRGYD